MSEAQWFASRLRELREGAGLTQQQLADRAGLTRDGVAQLEQGRRSPGWDTVVSLVHALGVDANSFMQAPRSGVERPGPGRPPKSPVEGAGPPQPKRPRGRPSKAPGVPLETPRGDKEVMAPSAEKPEPKGRSGRKSKD